METNWDLQAQLYDRLPDNPIVSRETIDSVQYCSTSCDLLLFTVLQCFAFAVCFRAQQKTVHAVKFIRDVRASKK